MILTNRLVLTSAAAVCTVTVSEHVIRDFGHWGIAWALIGVAGNLLAVIDMWRTA